MEEEDEFSDGIVDPRVQTELEKLNKASTQINEWENQLDLLRNKYRTLLSESTTSLSNYQNKLGSCVEKARPYFEAKKKQAEALHDSQDAARRYDRSCSLLEAAKEILQTTEAKAKETSPLDPALLEMLNHAVVKVNEAKNECYVSRQEHERFMSVYQEVDQEVKRLEQKFKSDIKKARPYFEMVKRFNFKMQEEKMRLDTYQEKVMICKSIYAEALGNLEKISLEIHQQRENDRVRAEMGQRGEGVGAEEVSEGDPSPSSRNWDTSKTMDTNQSSSNGLLKLETQKSLDKLLPGNTDSMSPISPSEVTAIIEALRTDLDQLKETSPVASAAHSSTSRRSSRSSKSSGTSIKNRLDATPIVGILHEQLLAQSNNKISPAQTNRPRSSSQPNSSGAGCSSNQSSETSSLNITDESMIDFNFAKWQLEDTPALAQPGYYFREKLLSNSSETGRLHSPKHFHPVSNSNNCQTSVSSDQNST